MTDTDWIAPGAEVLIYSRAARDVGLLCPRHTTIAKVAKASFTVSLEDEPRIKFDTQESARQVDTWHGYYRRVVPLGSNEARLVTDRYNRHVRLQAAKSAVDKWQRNPTRESRLAAIVALEAVED